MNRLQMMATLLVAIAITGATAHAQEDGEEAKPAGKAKAKTGAPAKTAAGDQIGLLSKRIKFLEDKMASLQKLVENQPRLDHLYYTDRHRSSIEELGDQFFVDETQPKPVSKDWELSPSLIEKFGVPKEAIAVRLEIRVNAGIGVEPAAGGKARVQVDVQAPNKKGRIYSAIATAPDQGQDTNETTLEATVFIQDGKFNVRVDQEAVGTGSSISREIRLMGYLMPAP